jgi:hypothetical protein
MDRLLPTAAPKKHHAKASANSRAKVTNSLIGPLGAASLPARSREKVHHPRRGFATSQKRSAFHLSSFIPLPFHLIHHQGGHRALEPIANRPKHLHFADRYLVVCQDA